MTIERPRRWYFIPALLAVMLVTMGFGGIWVGPKEKKVKLGKTTRDKLAEDFLAAASTKDGRFSIYSFYKWKDPGPLNPFGKAKWYDFGLLLVEFDEAGVAVRKIAHQCGKNLPGTLCEGPMNEALLHLIKTHVPDEMAGDYDSDHVWACEIRSALGFQVTQSSFGVHCPEGQDTSIQFQPTN